MSQQLQLEDFTWQNIDGQVDNKAVYSSQEMDSFSEWHRHELPKFYPWTDIDYVGFDHDRERIYILIEYKELPMEQFDPFQPSNPPDNGETQLAVYYYLAKSLGAPAYLVWHPMDMKPEQFKIDPIKKIDGNIDYQKDERVEATGMHEFADWLDEQKERYD